jgi:hypothetical protein
MRVGDYFKIHMPRNEEVEIIYEAVVVSSDSDWVSAKVVYPTHVAEKLRSEGVFRIHLASLDVIILGNPKTDPVLEAIYG